MNSCANLVKDHDTFLPEKVEFAWIWKLVIHPKVHKKNLCGKGVCMVFPLKLELREAIFSYHNFIFFVNTSLRI